ncbi:MAG: putative multidrug-efflux transporter [Alphaproteobacteria bacterium MarineAlpha2_Bin1]|nr:MAG: putative multidrug-efflux transporter [Alphaproteobacteria bacterium MarineAlpha2_Bin1]
MQIQSNEREWIHLFKNGKSIYTITILIGISLHAMDAFIISTLMPTIIYDLGNVEFYSWVLMLYMTASIIGSSCAEIVRNFFGARNGYILAGLIFLIGTLISGLSFSMIFLLFGRLISGFGAGLIVAQNTSLIREFFSEKLRIKMITLLSTIWGLAALTGPLIGGFFAEINFWRGGFLFAIPLILIFMITALKAIPTSKKLTNKVHFPFFRIIYLGLGVFLIGCTAIFNSIFIQLVAITLGLSLLYLSIKLDTKSKTIDLFPKKPFSIKSATGTAYWYFIMISILPVAIGIYMPLTYQVVYGMSPIVAGYLGALLAVFWTIGAAISSNFSIKNQKIAIIFGPMLSFISVLLISFGIGNFSWIYVAILTAFAGCGIGFCMGHLVNWTMILSKKGEESITASSIHTVRSLGISLGAAGSGLIANMSGLKDKIDPLIVTKSVQYVELFAALAPAFAIILGYMLISHRNRIEKFSY